MHKRAAQKAAAAANANRPPKTNTLRKKKTDSDDDDDDIDCRACITRGQPIGENKTKVPSYRLLSLLLIYETTLACLVGHVLLLLLLTLNTLVFGAAALYKVLQPCQDKRLKKTKSAIDQQIAQAKTAKNSALEMGTHLTDWLAGV